MRKLLFLFLFTAAVTPASALETFCEGNEDMLARYLEMSDVLFNGERDETRAGEYYAEKFRSPDVDVRRDGDADRPAAQRPGAHARCHPDV